MSKVSYKSYSYGTELVRESSIPQSSEFILGDLGKDPIAPYSTGSVIVL